MFSDQSFEPTGFTSQVSTEKSQTTANIQTETVVYESKDTQNTELRSASTQTLEAPKPEPTFDYEKLAAFLNKVTPGVIEVLDEVYGSNAFEGYEPRASGEPTAHVELSSSKNISFGRFISALSWSSGGGRLAVGHSEGLHSTWCDHLSRITIYKLLRDDQLADIEEKTLETEGCIGALSYHPIEPSILAAGLINGDVLLWNLRDDDSVTPMQICSHDDIVTTMLWRPRTLTEATNLVTTSDDGYILINTLTANFTNVSVNKRLKIAKEHNPAESTRPRSSGGRKERVVEAGLSIKCLDFSSKDSTIFIVGTLCGGLYKCSIDKATPIDLEIGEDEENLQDPVIDEYERHEGSITAVKCSPTNNIFVTTGIDKQIRIYDFAQGDSLMTIDVEHTFIGLKWYLGANRDIIAGYGVGQNIKFYDVKNGNIVTDIELSSSRKNTLSLDFNFKRDLVAVGDSERRLEIWKIPRQSIP